MTNNNPAASEVVMQSLANIAKYIGAHRYLLQELNKTNPSESLLDALFAIDRAQAAIEETLKTEPSELAERKALANSQFGELQSGITQLLIEVKQTTSFPVERTISMRAPRITHAANLITIALAH